MTARARQYHVNRMGFDPHKRLASAVIVQAVRDLDSDNSVKRESAIDFLNTDMEPFAELAELPEGYQDRIARKMAS